MKERIRKKFAKLPLSTRIRYSFLVIILPLAFITLLVAISVISSNKRYEDMMNSAVLASEFSVDFKKDYDYETYLVIVGNKTIEESGLDTLIEDANRVVDGIEKLTTSKDNADRLSSVKKYLSNLSSYKERIEENLQEGNRYEDNIEIWENDVQIVTSLVRETIFQYIFFEIREIQQARDAYQKFFVAFLSVMAVLFVGILTAVVYMSYAIPESITKPIREITDVTNQVAGGDLSVRANEYEDVEASVLSDSLNTMIDKINDLLAQVTEEQINLREAELELLQAQINPHFLYNTLDTIVWLAEGNRQKEVVEMVKNLSDFFRTSLSRGREMVSLSDELLHVSSYLKIQQVRYQDILDYEVNVDESLYAFQIPKISIQPLVENALYHGIKNKRGLGKITITSEKETDHFNIVIIDDGIGMSSERLTEVRQGLHDATFSPQVGLEKEKKKNMYGLLNVNERIKLKFGNEYGISIDSEYQSGSVVKVRLPYRMEAGE
ncbi:MAG: sensor histidine kinase [Lachnospiraceae bacterium]|nr:sensor histidine kinase [Lachnospiraceae bacterium]